MSMDDLTANLLVLVAELIVVVVVFLFVGWVAGRILGSMISIPALKRFEGLLTLLRRKLRWILVLICLALTVGLAGFNGYLMYRGEKLKEYTLELLQGIPRSFWVELAIAAGKIAGLVVLTALVLRLVRRVLDFACERTKAFEGIKANDESIDGFFAALKRIASRAAWLLVIAYATVAFGLPAGISNAALILLKIYLIIATGLLCWRGLDAFIASVDALSKKYSSSTNMLRFYDRMRHLVPLFRRSVEYVIYVTVASLVVLQIELIATLAGWGPRLIRIIGVVFLSRVAIELANLVIEETLITRARLTLDQKQRRQTLVPLIRSGLKYAIYFCAAVIVLKELGINPTPVLAGAGIAGLAVGLGAQNLINDVVSGFFILFEEHYLVGDFIKAGDAEGAVESIDLRTTRVRDNDGRHHILRNGQIGNLVNYSKSYTHAVVEVGVAYESDLDRVLAVLESVGEKFCEAHEDVLEPTMVKGLNAFGESELTIRTVTKVKPGRHLQAERDLRKWIKKTFDEESIEIPYARRVLIFKNPENDPTAGGEFAPTAR